MTTPTEAQRREWMAQWRSAAIALERVRLMELRSADLARIATDLDDASCQAARARAAIATSGLIAQQRLFHRRPRA
ncbi:MAG: hypothetical protein SGI84_01370 [Gemmatimonadota bacterium]|nr:hypothetical protein [Gemmatimonadota bacterium]